MGFRKKIAKSESQFSVPRAVLYEKGALAILQKRMATVSSRDVLVSLPNALEGTSHSVGSLHGQSTQREVRVRTTTTKNRDVCWSSETS